MTVLDSLKKLRPRGSVILLGFSLVLILIFYFSLPRPLFNPPYANILLADQGEMLGAKIAKDGQWRFPPAACPKRFAIALMAYEDHRFRSHPGIDPFSIIRALIQNIRAHKVVSGASTLTMQVIRLSRQSQNRILGSIQSQSNLSPQSFRSLKEKIIEAYLALRLTASFSKDSVLSLYAAHAPFGGNVVGLSAAAWRYYGRNAESLSWAEAALFAVLPNSPALIHPGRNRQILKSKRDRLLDKIYQQGQIDSVTWLLAKIEPLPDKPIPLPRLAPQLIDYANKSTISSSPLLWQTSIRVDLQSQIQEILHRHQGPLAAAGIQNAAVLVLDTKTGATLAYLGNMPINLDQMNAQSNSLGSDVDIIQAPRSTGSLLKPFLYAAKLDAGEILPNSLVPDIPTQIAGYTPENFDREYEGAVPASMALARSLNIPAVRMLRDFGIDRFLHVLHNLGMTTANRSADDYGLTLVLGGAEGTLWELTGIYAGLGREAMRNQNVNSVTKGSSSFFPPHFLLNQPDRPIQNKTVTNNIGPAGAWFALQAMAEVSRPDADKNWRGFSSSRWVAWKTGTSFGFRDAWAVGVTPEFTVGIWVGNASGQGRPGMTGIQLAAPILFETFNLLPPTTLFEKPMASLQQIPLCHQSGMRPSPWCPQIDTALVPEAGLRTAACPYHRLIHLDAQMQYQVNDACASVSEMKSASWFVLPLSQEWYYRLRHSDYLPLPPWRKDCEGKNISNNIATGITKSMELLYPRKDTKIYIPVELNAERGATVFEAVHRNKSAIVYWHLDQEYLGSTQEFHKMEIRAKAGDHTILLVDDHGERLEQNFQVLPSLSDQNNSPNASPNSTANPSGRRADPSK